MWIQALPLLPSLLLSRNWADHWSKDLFSGIFPPYKSLHLQIGWECKCWLNEGVNFLWYRCHRSIQSAGTAMEKLSLYNSLVSSGSKQQWCQDNTHAIREMVLSWGVDGKEKWFMPALTPHWNNTKQILKLDDGKASCPRVLFSITLLIKTTACIFIVQQAEYL